MKHLAIFLFAVSCILRAFAHDPYEITSVAYIYSNRIELFVEMEFPTGMKLAGLTPTRDVSALSQFESAQTQLRELAGKFFEFTAGNNVVLPLRTNIGLGVEDHIRFQLEFAPTPHRPLQFAARGLRGANDSPYGTSLTVLDMVNRKVLGQTTLFADSATAEFSSATNIAATPQPVQTSSEPTNDLPINPLATNPTMPESSAKISPRRPYAYLVLALALIAGTVTILRWLNQKSDD